jgi:hypothetical protein
LLGIAAEPAEKPDARLLALDSHSALTPLSQSVSPDGLTLIIEGSNDLKSFSDIRLDKARTGVISSDE